MKKLALLFSVITTALVAQVPRGFNYQAALRDASGAVISNQAVSVKIELIQGSVNYFEVHSVTTNPVGLINLTIGYTPAANSDLFSDIDWAVGGVQLKTSYDAAGGASWVLVGVSQLQSVPYALSSADRFSGDFSDLTNVPTLDTSNSNELQTIASSGDTIFLSQGGSVYFHRFSGNFSDLTGVPPMDTSNVNEIQTLSRVGDTLKLSNGGNVVLPLSLKAEKIDDLTDGKTVGTSLALGMGALQAANLTGINNTAVGINTLQANLGGNNNTAIGSEVLKVNASGSQNTAIGQQAMLANTGGDHNTAVGTQALRSNTSGHSNTAVGHDAMQLNVSGTENTVVGRNALKNTTTSWGNTVVGFEAVQNATGTNPNDAFGFRALNSLTVGNSNVAVGNGSLQALGAVQTVEQHRNTVVGHGALYRMTAGSNNIGLGNEVGAWLTGGSYNVLIGGASAASNVAQRVVDGNVIIGYDAASSISNGAAANTIIGRSAMANLLDGQNNIAIGNSTADKITKGNHNIFIGGYSSGNVRTLPVYSNVAIGGGTGSSLDSNAYANVLIGENAGNMMRGGSDNTAIGHAALQMSPKGGYNVAVGTQAMQMSNVETSSNTAVGAQSLVNVKSSQNTAVGKGSQNQTTTGAGNTSLGASSMTSNTTGSNNVAIGLNAMHSNTTGFGNTSMGTYSLNSNQTGQENVAVGFSAMAGNISGSSNTAVGLYTLYGYQGLTGSYNTALGAHVLTNTKSGQGNTGMGYWVFPNLKAGSYNIGIGNNVGSNVRGASENILIGHESNVKDSMVSNSVAIGYQAVAKASNTVQLGNSNVTKVATSGRFEGKGAGFRDSSSAGDNAILRLSSNTKGFVFPTMTYAERQNVTPEVGMAIYCKNCGNGGQLQIYNGSIWTDFSGNIASGKQLSVGDTAFGGVVAYLLTPNDSGYSATVQHGIIIAQNDLTYGMQWGCMTLIPSSNLKIKGMINQQRFLLLCPNSSSSTAMMAVSNLTLNGFTDWVLPSKDDLLAIYTNRVQLSGYLNSGTYWSSTDNGNGAGAWNVNLTTGLTTTFLKNDTYHRTKPVRYF
jgi:hypothetical protein